MSEASLAALSAEVDALDPRYVAVHWRHGDYTVYKLLSSRKQMVGQVQHATGPTGLYWGYG